VLVGQADARRRLVDLQAFVLALQGLGAVMGVGVYSILLCITLQVVHLVMGMGIVAGMRVGG